MRISFELYHYNYSYLNIINTNTATNINTIINFM